MANRHINILFSSDGKTLTEYGSNPYFHSKMFKGSNIDMQVTQDKLFLHGKTSANKQEILITKIVTEEKNVSSIMLDGKVDLYQYIKKNIGNLTHGKIYDFLASKFGEPVEIKNSIIN